MFFRAKSQEEADEISGMLDKDRAAKKTRIRLEGGPSHGVEVDLSPLEIKQGFMASSRGAMWGRTIHGVYEPSEQPNVWKYRET